MDRLFTPDFEGRPWWWEAAQPEDGTTSELPDSTDVCIVGGGYAGLNCALELARSGTSCVVLDAQRIGAGASSRNGGLVTGGVKLAAGHAAQLGEERARRLSAEAIGTLQFVEDLIRREDIDCDFARTGRFTCAWSRGHYESMAAKTERLAELTGEPVYMVSPERQREEIGSDYYRGGQVIEASATLHPAKYVRGLAAAAAREGAVLVGGVRARGLTRQVGGWHVATDRGTVRAVTTIVLIAIFLVLLARLLIPGVSGLGG